MPSDVKRDPLRDIPHYLRVFQTHLGGRMYLIFALGLGAALAEGFGILMLLPLLQGLDGSGAEATTGVGKLLGELLAALGLGQSSVGVLLFIGAAFLLKGLFLFGSGAYRALLEAQLMREIKARLFDDYSRMSYRYYSSRNTGHFINVINGQANAFYIAFNAMMGLGSAVITTVIYLGLAFAVAWRFGLMALVIGVLLLLLFRALNRYVRELSRKSVTEHGHLAALLIQTLQAFKYLAATGQVGHFRTAVMGSIYRLTGYQARTGIAYSFTGAIREPLSVLFIIAIVVVQLVVLNQPLAPIMVSILLFHRGLGSVLGIQTAWQGTLGLVGSVEMVCDELAELARHREPDGPYQLGPLSRSIELRGVHFAYTPELGEVLKDVSLKIPIRQSVALVGESGAGKSTLVDILTLMLKPTQGQVLIDGMPGDRIQLASWRRQIGYVSQETVVFDDTIANNICLWEGDASRDPALLERVRQAARQAHIARFIESLPEGYASMVGDRGMRLSGGQRQRLFVARELFKQPNLLILDEATSALDSESEQAIQASIDALKGRITVVIIAHRLSTIRNVDYVYVFDQGSLVEQGPYQQLRDADDSRFRRMVAMQTL
ncbi:Xenobiotic-transporting ATPase [Thiocapsa marina 5811]|uniref:Xenobiotic-transporting ATPase n=2 Tax=Thiocapsa marina TaxID=244573 RepID=F9UBU4_9GAMM|nr:Xenobiotic-transporting ATPase [Thiocapsa marina 5811]